MKKTIALILTLIMCIGLLAACGDKAVEDTSKAKENVDQSTIGNTNTGGSTTAESVATPPPAEAEYVDDLSMYIGDKVALIDPLNAGAQTSQSGIICHLVFDNLVYYAIDNTYQPSLATEWSMNDDATEYTFKLRDDVKWHNGEPFTSDDVLFTWERCEEATGSHVYNVYHQVKDIKCNGDYELTFTLSAPNVDFLYDISNPSAPVVNRDAYESGMENPGWIGTGPYCVESMIPNDSIELVRNEEYWGQMGYAKHFQLRYIAEETARNIMLENDEFTFCQIGSVYIPQYENDDRFVINSYVMNNCNYIAFNMKKPITGDINFRTAVAYALDRQEIVDIALGGYGKAVDCRTFWGNKTAYKNLDLPVIEKNIETAKEYLAKSCYNGEEIELAAGMAHTIKTATVVLEQLRAIGVNAIVHEYDGPSMTAATAYDSNDCDIVVGSGTWSPLASSCKSYFTPGNNSNKACYENQEVIDLVAEAAGTPDGDKRQAMYYRIQEIVAEDMPYLGTMHMAMYSAAQKGAGGAILFPTNNHDYGAAYRLKNAE